MKRFLLLTAVVLMMTFFITSPVMAANRYDDGTCEVDVCMGWPEAVTAMVTVAVRNMGLGILKTVAGVAWLLDKAALFIFDLVVHGAIWKALRAGLLDSLAAFMPDVLTDLIGGPEGLLYIALLVAGISMTVPSLNSRLVNPGRAILWAAVVMAVFGSGALGYDLIGLVEELRSNTMERIINAGSEGDITSLVTGPMLANEDDILLTNKSLLELPDAFEDFYFLKPQGYLTVRTIFFEGPASYDAVADMELETDDSLEKRRERAIPGVFIALISLVGGYAALLFALVFALLMTASLGLIIFLFAALPMGLFEFGKTVVGGILNKYLQIVILSIGASIFTGIVGMTISVIPTSVSTLSDALTQVAILMPILGIQHMFVKWSFEAMIDTKSVFRRTMQTAFRSGAGGPAPPGIVRKGTAGALRAAGTVATLAFPVWWDCRWIGGQ